MSGSNPGPRRAAGVVSGLLSACLLVGAGCDDRKVAVTRAPNPVEPSPNASILPAPLSSGVEAVAATGKIEEDAGRRERDAGRSPSDAGFELTAFEPRALREDQALPSEAPRETTGLSLSARFRWPDVASAPRVLESNLDGLQRARDAVGFDVAVDLAGGRMRFVLESRAFTLARGGELHARDDLYGHALLWPDRATYTLFGAGALRSVLAEGRADVVPLVRAKVSALPAGTLFGFVTERVELATPTGKLTLEQARTSPSPSGAGPWASGASLCHLLLELCDAAPVSVSCRSELVPMRADYTWPNGQRFSFEVTRVTRRIDLEPSTLAMPPTGAQFRQAELPAPPPSALLSEAELMDFRVRALPRLERVEPGSPKNGLLLANHGESLRYVSVDGVLAARLAPAHEELLSGLRGGKYQLSARDFFNAEEPFTRILEVPARFPLGDESERAR